MSSDHTPPQFVEDAGGALPPLPGPGFKFGHLVDEVQGSGALAMPEFVPTRAELRVLVEHWARIVIDVRYGWVIYEATGSWERRIKPFAEARLAQLAHVLGAEAAALRRDSEDAFLKEHRLTQTDWEAACARSRDRDRVAVENLDRHLRGVEPNKEPTNRPLHDPASAEFGQEGIS